MANLLYQGHGSLRITLSNKKVIYIDPFAGNGYDKPADLILITHEHYDHNNIEIVTKTDRTLIIRSADALQNGAYYSFDYWGMHIQAVPAYNDKHNKEECVGYIVDCDGVRIYFSGDTSTTEYMKTLADQHIDYLFLPIDGIYNMGPEEATECAKLINPKHFVPIHMKPGMLWDYRQCMMVTAPMAMLMKPGDEIYLTSD